MIQSTRGIEWKRIVTIFIEHISLFLFAAFQIGKHEKKYFQSIGKQKLIKTHMRTPDHHRTPIVTNNKKTHSKRKNVVHSLKIKFSLNRDGRTDARKYIHIRLLAV